MQWLKDVPADPTARLVLAHGAGAPMDSEFMQAVAQGLCDYGVEVWRFEFPYMAQRRSGGSKRPPPPKAQLLDAFDAAVADARVDDLPLFVGGKSLGGRMASLLAERVSVAGVVCLGYPFHPRGQPEKTRTEHLQRLQTPVLIVQGSRDALGNREQVRDYSLSRSVQVRWLEDGDHDFKPRVKSGYRQADHWHTAVQWSAGFMAHLMEPEQRGSK